MPLLTNNKKKDTTFEKKVRQRLLLCFSFRCIFYFEGVRDTRRNTKRCAYKNQQGTHVSFRKQLLVSLLFFCMLVSYALVFEEIQASHTKENILPVFYAKKGKEAS